MRFAIIFSCLLVAVLAQDQQLANFSCTPPPKSTLSNLDLNAFNGLWYTVARSKAASTLLGEEKFMCSRCFSTVKEGEIDLDCKCAVAADGPFVEGKCKLVELEPGTGDFHKVIKKVYGSDVRTQKMADDLWNKMKIVENKLAEAVSDLPASVKVPDVTILAVDPKGAWFVANCGCAEFLYISAKTPELTPDQIAEIRTSLKSLGSISDSALKDLELVKQDPRCDATLTFPESKAAKSRFGEIAEEEEEQFTPLSRSSPFSSQRVTRGEYFSRSLPYRSQHVTRSYYSPSSYSRNLRRAEPTSESLDGITIPASRVRFVEASSNLPLAQTAMESQGLPLAQQNVRA